MAERLASQTEGRAHIILLGRNKDAAEKIIAGFPRHDESVYEFERVDATSMADVRRVTRSLLERLDKLNFIVASAGFLTMKGRDETEEGIDKKLACNVYARFRFALDLLPLLESAGNAGEDAKFMTILGAGKEPTSYLNLDDLGLKKEYSLVNAAAVGSHYNDALVEVCVTFLSIVVPTNPYPTPGVRTEISERFLHAYSSRCCLDTDDHKLPLVNEAVGTPGAPSNNEPCGLRRVDVELSLEQ
jgi:NAD(P)-dependent dehydrogenase (short-subunit alcohol dehydrogenase family)